MPTNDFLPIAIGGTPNVQSQPDYVASTPRGQGYPDEGIPPANEWNKMLRQSSCIAAMIAQVVCNITGQNMPDDGDQATKIALFASMFRYRLTGPTTFYVATTGSDVTGDGSIGNPWRTGQHAVNTLMLMYDWAGYGVSISRADGTYTDSVLVSGRFVGQSSALNFTGSGAAGVIVNVTTDAYCYEAFEGAVINVQNQKMTNSVGGALYASQGGTISYNAINIGACAGTAILADRTSRCIALGPSTLSGNVTNFAAADGASSVELGGFLLTLTGVPVISNAFALVSDRGGVSAVGMTFSGTFTGKRYDAKLNSVINTNSGNVNFFPGTVAGTTSGDSSYA